MARTSVTGVELALPPVRRGVVQRGYPAHRAGRGAALGGGYLAHRVGRQLTVGAFDGWLAGLCALAGELAVYAGWPPRPGRPPAPGQPRVWALATAAAILLGMRKAARLCRPARPVAPPGGPRRVTQRPGPGRTLAAVAARLPGLPAGSGPW